MSGRTISTTAYVQVARDERRSWRDEGVVRNVTNRRPATVLPGCIVVKVRIRIPAAAWEPLQPEAVIDVPADLVQHPVEVEAVEP